MRRAARPCRRGAGTWTQARLRRRRAPPRRGAAGRPGTPPLTDAWRRGPGVEPGFIVDLLIALGQIDDALTGRAADHILAWPKTYGLDTVLVPAVRRLLGSSTIRGSAAVQRLRVVCLDHLRARIAQPLEAPQDWRRANALACSCRHCIELGRFLADPERRMWTFKAAEAERGHVEGTVTRARCDLDLTTDKREPALYPGLHQEPGELRPPGQAAQARSGGLGTDRSVIFPADTRKARRAAGLFDQTPMRISAAKPPHVPGRRRAASRGSPGCRAGTSARAM